MKSHKPIPQELLAQLVYDETSPTCLRWKTRRSGKVPADLRAGTRRADGYCALKFKGVAYYAHRLVWTLVNGAIGAGLEVDHIDHTRDNNRIENLRLLKSEHNIRRQVGRVGYEKHPTSGNYRVRMHDGDRHLTIGTFSTEEEARQAYLAAKRQFEETL